MVQALILEANRPTADPDDEKKQIRRMDRLARTIFDKAVAGDMGAIQFITDRIDGKVPEALKVEEKRHLTRIDIEEIKATVKEHHLTIEATPEPDDETELRTTGASARPQSPTRDRLGDETP